jgi:sugar phosphate isomerase/epimerase
MTNEQRELAARLRWASAASKVSAQNVNYQCSVTIADAEAAATTIEQLAERCGRLEAALSNEHIDFLQRWVRTPNPMLGNAVPIEMMRAGRGDRVAAFIDSTQSETEVKP